MLCFRLTKRKSSARQCLFTILYVVIVWVSWVLCETPFYFFHISKYISSESIISKGTFLISHPTDYTENKTEKEPFMQPAVGVVTSPFGERWGRIHEGIDIGGEHASDIKAAASGTVILAQWVDGYGNYVELDHGNGLKTVYGHCHELLVTKGELVSGGQRIATMGSTGNSTGTHLHFEIILNGEPQNPLNYVIY